MLSLRSRLCLSRRSLIAYHRLNTKDLAKIPSLAEDEDRAISTVMKEVDALSVMYEAKGTHPSTKFPLFFDPFKNRQMFARLVRPMVMAVRNIILRHFLPHPPHHDDPPIHADRTRLSNLGIRTIHFDGERLYISNRS